MVWYISQFRRLVCWKTAEHLLCLKINLSIKLAFVSLNGPRETYFVESLRIFTDVFNKLFYHFKWILFKFALLTLKQRLNFSKTLWKHKITIFKILKVSLFSFPPAGCYAWHLEVKVDRVVYVIFKNFGYDRRYSVLVACLSSSSY